MMTLKELTKLQKSFDSEHKGNFCWSSKITDENLELLEFLLISLTGEVGETANIVKKVVRGDFTLESKKDDLQKEIADVFIYLLKISYQLGIDLEEAYLQKLDVNRRKFKKYEQGREKKCTCE